MEGADVFFGIICGMLCFMFVFFLSLFWDWLLRSISDEVLKEKLTFGGFLAVSAVVGFLVSWLCQKDQQIDMQQHQAIERGYALHCPADGKFAWVGECEQKGEGHE